MTAEKNTIPTQLVNLLTNRTPPHLKILRSKKSGTRSKICELLKRPCHSKSLVRLPGTKSRSDPKILVGAHMRHTKDKVTTRSDNTHNSLKDQKKRCANTSKIKRPIKMKPKTFVGGNNIRLQRPFVKGVSNM